MSTDSIAKSAGIGRIGAIIAALSLTQLQGLVTAIVAFLNACGVSVSQGMHDSIIGVLEAVLPIYIIIVSGRSKFAEDKVIQPKE